MSTVTNASQLAVVKRTTIPTMGQLAYGSLPGATGILRKKKKNINFFICN